MRTMAIAFFVFLSISGCGFFDTMTNGWEHSKAVEADLERIIGSKPFVGFSWANGSLQDISIVFTGIPSEFCTEQIAVHAHASIANHFERTPKQVTIMFTVRGE